NPNIPVVEGEIKAEICDTSIEDGFYCKICGALLYDKVEEAVQFLQYRFDVSEIDNLLMNFIWKETARIIGYTVKSKLPTKHLITDITNATYSKISSKNIDLAKEKSNTEEYISGMLILYTNMYVC